MADQEKAKYELQIEALKRWLNDIGADRSVKALKFAVKSHKGQFRKPRRDKVPYIVHPVEMTLHALSLGIENDDMLAAILLHDVVEDCDVALKDLPCSDDTRRWVRLLTKDKQNYSAREYYAAIAADPKASFIKCLDRINNLSGAATGFESVAKVRAYALDTKEYFDALIQSVGSYPFAMYCKAAWLFGHQLYGLVTTILKLTESSEAAPAESDPS